MANAGPARRSVFVVGPGAPGSDAVEPDGGQALKRWQFSTDDHIASGSFGHIYRGRDLDTDEPVAVKVESRRTVHPQLEYESKIFALFEKVRGFPRVYHFCREDRRNIMVMQLLGPNLEELFVKCKRRFQLRTVLILAEMMLRRVESFHSRGYVHRDIKPENFLLGRGDESHLVYLIDIGLSKKYFDRGSRRHIPFRDDKKLTGTARYVSTNTHAGYEQSRRDDLEALGHVFLYFLRGELPWQGQGGDTKSDKYARIHKVKRETTLEELCKDLPGEFLSYMRYCRSLSFEEVPNYSSLRKLFRDLMEVKGYSHDGPMEWETVSQDETTEESRANSNVTAAAADAKKDNGKVEGKKEAGPRNASEVTNPPTVHVDPRIIKASSFVRKKK